MQNSKIFGDQEMREETKDSIRTIDSEQDLSKSNKNSDKPKKFDPSIFKFDPSINTKICSYKLCSIVSSYAEKHFILCTGFQPKLVNGLKMYRYQLNGEVIETPYFQMSIPGRKNKGAENPYAKEEDWAITRE